MAVASAMALTSGTSLNDASSNQVRNCRIGSGSTSSSRKLTLLVILAPLIDLHAWTLRVSPLVRIRARCRIDRRSIKVATDCTVRGQFAENAGMKFLTKRHTAATMLYSGSGGGSRAGRASDATSRARSTTMHIPDMVAGPEGGRGHERGGSGGAVVRGPEAGATARRADDRPDGDDVGVRLRRADGELPGLVRASPGICWAGVLSAVLLGPWAGAVVIAAVLIVQCFLFNDGGVTALGANFVNMGLIGAVGGYAIYAPIRRAIGGPKGMLIAAMVAAWFSVLLASGAFAVELAASGQRDDFLQVLTWMALVHSLIGVGEALITGIVVRFVLLRRPDLLEPDGESQPTSPAGAGWWVRPMVAGLGIALGVAVFLAPFACESPDGLEFVGEHHRVPARRGDHRAPPLPSPMADYELKLPGLDHAPGGDRAGRPGRDAGRLRPELGHGADPAAAEARRGRRPMRLDGLERHRAGDRAAPPARCPDQADRRAGLDRRRDRHADRPPGASYGAAGLAPGLRRSDWPGIPPRELARRWLGLFVLVAFLTVMIAPAHPERARYGLAVGGRQHPDQERPGPADHDRAGGHDALPQAADGACASWACRPSWSRRSSSWTDTAMCWSTRSTAWPPRGGRGPSGRRGTLSWSLLGGLIGMLFLRTFERAERVHDAMIARGWDGTIRSLDD